MLHYSKFRYTKQHFVSHICILRMQSKRKGNCMIYMVLHEPFFPPKHIPDPMVMRDVEIKLKDTRRNASAAIGHMIAVRFHLLSPGAQAYLTKSLLPFVSQNLPNVHFRVQKCYSQLLLVCKIVRYMHCFINK